MKRKAFTSFLLAAIMCISTLCPMDVLAKKVVSVKSISLSKSSVVLTVKSTYTLSAAINPSNATYKSVSWASSNNSVASVKGGKITACKAGTCTITAKTSNSRKASCKVTVKNQSTTVKSIGVVSVTTTTGKKPAMPSKVTVTMSDNSTKSVGVTWNAISPASYASAGTVIVSGTVSIPSAIKAICKVTVKGTSATVKSIITVNVTTSVGTAPVLPTTVTATMSDNSTKSVAVLWDPISPSSYASTGTFTVSGKISESSTVRATCKVTVQNSSAAIKSVNSINVSTVAGTAPVLPATVTATMVDGTTKSVAVTWNAISPSSYANAGTFAVIGTVSSTVQTTAIVTVTSSGTTGIKSINPVSVTTVVGRAPILPSTVIAVMGDGSSKCVDVKWNAISASSYANTGTFAVIGTVDSSSIQATATVTVSATSTVATVETINPVNVTTNIGTAPDLPTTVTATMSDGTTRNYVVSWNVISYSSYANAGSFTVIGTITASSTVQAMATVTVLPSSTSATIRSINQVSVNTLAGTAPDLPTTVSAVMSDGTTKYVSVTWDTCYPSQYASAGAFTISGTVSGSSTVRATAIVIVTGTSSAVTIQSVNPVYVTTSIGTAPNLPATVSAVMSDGSTKNFTVTWVYYSPSSYATYGTFTVKGIIATNTTIQATATVLVTSSSASAAVQSINPVSVTTMAGTAPDLPTTVTAVMSDGTTKNYPVTWNTISPSSYASTGTFTVYGTISATSSVTATAIVTVG